VFERAKRERSSGQPLYDRSFANSRPDSGGRSSCAAGVAKAGVERSQKIYWHPCGFEAGVFVGSSARRNDESDRSGDTVSTPRTPANVHHRFPGVKAHTVQRRQMAPNIQGAIFRNRGQIWRHRLETGFFLSCGKTTALRSRRRAWPRSGLQERLRRHLPYP